MKKVDLNVDIGEGFPNDAALLEFATSANICMGVHAGSQELTQQTIDLCVRKKVRIGCHPGYPDREHMGRRSILTVEKDEAYAWIKSVRDQLCEQDLSVYTYCKPHGALYNDTAMPIPSDLSPWEDADPFVDEGRAARTWFASLSEPPPFAVLKLAHKPLMGLAGTAHELIDEKHGFLREGFADRRYTLNGLLVPRSKPNAILEDPEEIARQVLQIAPRVDSICLHGDTPHCLEFAELVNKTLVDAGYEVGF